MISWLQIFLPWNNLRSLTRRIATQYRIGLRASIKVLFHFMPKLTIAQVVTLNLCMPFVEVNHNNKTWCIWKVNHSVIATITPVIKSSSSQLIPKVTDSSQIVSMVTAQELMMSHTSQATVKSHSSQVEPKVTEVMMSCSSQATTTETAHKLCYLKKLPNHWHICIGDNIYVFKME